VSAGVRCSVPPSGPLGGTNWGHRALNWGHVVGAESQANSAAGRLHRPGLAGAGAYLNTRSNAGRQLSCPRSGAPSSGAQRQASSAGTPLIVQAPALQLGHQVEAQRQGTSSGARLRVRQVEGLPFGAPARGGVRQALRPRWWPAGWAVTSLGARLGAPKVGGTAPGQQRGHAVESAGACTAARAPGHRHGAGPATRAPGRGAAPGRQLRCPPSGAPGRGPAVGCASSGRGAAGAAPAMVAGRVGGHQLRCPPSGAPSSGAQRQASSAGTPLRVQAPALQLGHQVEAQRKGTSSGARRRARQLGEGCGRRCARDGGRPGGRSPAQVPAFGCPQLEGTAPGQQRGHAVESAGACTGPRAPGRRHGAGPGNAGTRSRV